MYQKLLHTKGLRLLGGLLGSLLLAAAINVFIVPQGLYGGGAYGLCQVIRTLVLRALDLELPFDLAGVLYFCVNIPLFMLAFRALGREFFLKAAICTAANSLFLAIIPSPAVPVIPDMLTSCMVGGILVGFSGGLVLSCGCSTGGLDILGLYLSKRAAASPWGGSPSPSTPDCTPCASSCSTPPPPSTPLYIMCSATCFWIGSTARTSPCSC